MKFLLIAFVFAITVYTSTAQLRSREELLSRADELVQQAKDAIAKHSDRASVLQREEAVVARLASELKTLAEPHGILGAARLRAIEFELGISETVLAAEMKRLDGSTTLFKRDVKADLIAKAASLLTQSGPLIDMLIKQGKPLLAVGLQSIEKEVRTLETKLESLHPSNPLGQMAVEAGEELLKLAEKALDAEIKKLSAHVVFKRATSAELLAKAAGLLTKAEPVIQALIAANKPFLVTELQFVVREVKALEAKLKAANPHNELEKLAVNETEKLLGLAETKLDAEIKKLSTSTLFKRDLKTDLLTRAASLLTQSGPLIKILTEQGTPLLAAGLQLIETEVKKLEAKLLNSHPSNPLSKLAFEAAEELMKVAERGLEAEIKKLSAHVVSKRDVKADLLVKATELLTKSGGVIEMLKTQGKPLLATGLTALEGFVKTLEAKLLATEPHTTLGKLAMEGLASLLKVAENELEKEIQKLSAFL